MTTALTPDNPFVKRFIDYDSGHYSSGRADTWKEYYMYTSMKQLFVGVGPLATTSTIIYKYSTHHSFIGHPSNTYIYILLTYGIGGFIIFVIFGTKIFVRLSMNVHYRKSRTDYINIAVFLGCCAWGLGSYMGIIGSDVSMFYTYLVSQALSDTKNSA